MQTDYDEVEATISYVLVNTFASISIVFITVLESGKNCTADIYVWLCSYIFLLLLDSLIKAI